jgi:hypothetical protein
VTTGNGLAAGTCLPYAEPSATTTEYDEGIDLNQMRLNGGAPAGVDGGIQSIDPKRLVRDPAKGCASFYPWNFVRTNTISGVVYAAEKLMPGRRTRDAEPARQAIIQIAIRLELLPLGPGAQNGTRWAFAQKTSIPCRLHFQS